MVWSIVAKQALKPVLKQGAKKGAKKAAKKGAKQATKEATKKFAEKTILEKTITILDYSDPFYWAGRGIKSLVTKNAAKQAGKQAVKQATKKVATKQATKELSKQATKQVAKKVARRQVFRRGATKVGILTALAGGFTQVMSSVGDAIVSSEFLLPVAGAALGTWGMHKITTAIQKKKHKKETDNVDSITAVEARRIRKLTPEQIRAWQSIQRERAA